MPPVVARRSGPNEPKEQTFVRVRRRKRSGTGSSPVLPHPNSTSVLCRAAAPPARIAHFVEHDGLCRWEAVAIGADASPVTLAELPGPCAVSAVRAAPDGRRALVELTTRGVYRSSHPGHAPTGSMRPSSRRRTVPSHASRVHRSVCPSRQAR